MNLQTTESRILTPADVKEHLHIGRNAAYHLFACDASFPSFRIGRKHVILESQYMKWLEKKSRRITYTPYDKRKKK